eukprot:TRINITY_DN4984_c0_g1_i1.p1 TRINITY_DN4984_c0_g1~~TRINITY_DN4984_c0_g1_i1.p1  ORF type:complete len:693 (-),score=165.46 TRINITY_DN4984_c0_g1_i1:65-2089(-)
MSFYSFIFRNSFRSDARFKSVYQKSAKHQKLPTNIIFRRQFTDKLPTSNPRTGVIVGVLVGSAVLAYFLTSSELPEGMEIDWLVFRRDILPYGRNSIEKIEIMQNGQQAVVYLMGGNRKIMSIGDTQSFINKLQVAQNELGVDVWNRIPVTYRKEGFGSVIFSIIPSLVIIGLIYAIYRQTFSIGSKMGGGGLFGIGSSKAKMYTSDMKPKANFSNVAGLDEAKTEVMEFVHFLKNPDKYNNLGAKIPRGALLVGPPGTGKTLMAKAVAGEAGVPFFSISGSEFMEMFVGVGPARVRDLFAKARQKSPCIVFIDEIDAVGRKRDKSMRMSNDERENTLNQLLVEMDGFNTKSGVIVLAGTNRPDILDPALTRPGRFDRTINVDPPDLKGRKDILKVHLKPLKLEDPNIEMYAERIATLTPGMVGADLENICNEAALIAARNNKKFVQMEDLEAAIDRVIGGLEKKDKVISPKEKHIVAFHEAGHAVTGWFLEHASPLLKVSIIPRGSAALGYAQYQPKDQHIYTEAQLLDQMCVMLGGRISEELSFGSISTGASDDLERVTKLAYQMVTQLGMNKKIGHLSFKAPNTEMMEERAYSQKTSTIIDEEVRALVKRAEETTRTLLREHSQGLRAVAERLLLKEKIGKEDMVEILGARPWKELRSFAELSYETETPAN